MQTWRFSRRILQMLNDGLWEHSLESKCLPSIQMLLMYLEIWHLFPYKVSLGPKLLELSIKQYPSVSLIIPSSEMTFSLGPMSLKAETHLNTHGWWVVETEENPGWMLLGTAVSMVPGCSTHWLPSVFSSKELSASHKRPVRGTQPADKE